MLQAPAPACAGTQDTRSRTRPLPRTNAGLKMMRAGETVLDRILVAFCLSPKRNDRKGGIMRGSYETRLYALSQGYSWPFVDAIGDVPLAEFRFLSGSTWSKNDVARMTQKSRTPFPINRISSN